MNKKLWDILANIANCNGWLKYIGVRIWNGLGRLRYMNQFAKKYPVDERLVLFESFAGRQYSCNPRALYEELRDRPAYKKYKKVWAFLEPEKYRYLEKDPRTKVVAVGSREYYQACARAKIWVSNFRMRNELKPKKGQIYIQTWHGTPLKRLGFDIEQFEGSKDGQRLLEYQYVTDLKRYSYLLSPSEFYKEKLTSAFRLKDFHKDHIFIDGGYPRNDFLLRLTDEKIAEIKRKLRLPQDKKIILYAPTWRENQHVSGHGYRYKLEVDFAKWRDRLGENVLVLYRSHYLVGNSIDLTPFDGFVRNVSDYDDINDLYAVSGLLVTDYSSVFFDYANLNRPILFFMYDYENYKNELRGFYIDERELPGPVIRDEDQLLEVLKDYRGQGYEEIYRRFNETYNPYQKGDGAAIVWKKVLGKGKNES